MEVKWIFIYMKTEKDETGSKAFIGRVHFQKQIILS